MTHPLYQDGNPRFNHVALSVPAERLDEGGRRDLCDFWGEVLGFEELATMTVDRKRLILSCVHWDQFIFITADDDPMACPRLDHFGFAVGSRRDLEAVSARANAYRSRDDRVDLIDLHVDDQGPIKIHSLYLGYLLPMMCEIQWWEFVS